MSLPREQAWFAAKRYGYGWGLPLRWQGWVTLLVYVAAIITAAFTVAERHRAGFIIFSILLSAAFVGICYWKGEPAKWRWGDSENKS